jgi:hypothetical protein
VAIREFTGRWNLVLSDGTVVPNKWNVCVPVEPDNDEPMTEPEWLEAVGLHIRERAEQGASRNNGIVVGFSVAEHFSEH